MISIIICVSFSCSFQVMKIMVPSDKGCSNRADTSARTAKVNQPVTSHALLGEPGKLLILHQGEEYHLRITRKGKLILTK